MIVPKTPKVAVGIKQDNASKALCIAVAYGSIQVVTVNGTLICELSCCPCWECNRNKRLLPLLFSERGDMDSKKDSWTFPIFFPIYTIKTPKDFIRSL